MARNPDEFIEENAEQRDEDQAQDVADEARARQFNDTGPEGRDPTQDTQHGGRPNPASLIPEDTPDLVDTMNQMLTSGRIDNDAYAGEPMMDDEETLLGDTEDVDDDEDNLSITPAVEDEEFDEGDDERE